MNRAGICLCAVLLSSPLTFATDEGEVFRRALGNASRMSTLTLPGGPPFHLKVSAKERYHDLPEYRAEVEVWWASPEKWRREVRSATFSQKAVRLGELYFESNSTDYLPFWLHELIQESVDPVPLSELVREHLELTKRGCAEWQEPYAKEKETAYVHSSICFNGDGTVRQLFTPTLNVLLGNYREFEGKRIASSITTWPERGGEIVATVEELEPLRSDNSLFELSGKTPFRTRLRFVSAPEAALEVDTERSAPLVWPVVHNFPASGVMAVNVRIDREGAVREVGTIVSTNFVLTGAAREQILKWRFKPYEVDGTTVQVNTTLAIHFDAKMELLGTNGKALPVEPFLSRMRAARDLSDPRTSGSPPFHMQATIEDETGKIGTYDEMWVSKDRWRRDIHLRSVTLLVSCDGDQTSQKLGGAGKAPGEMSDVLDLLVAGHFPDRKYEVYEADWGQSAVTFAGTDTVRVARGKVDANNQPVSGQAYWFDFSGILRADYEEPVTTTYADFAPWSNKQVPRRLEAGVKGGRKWLVLIHKLEPLADSAARKLATTH